MAKTKISELEAACGADRKDIIAFLNEKGIDAKTAGSSAFRGNREKGCQESDPQENYRCEQQWCFGQATRRTEQRFRGEILPDRQQKTAGRRT